MTDTAAILAQIDTLNTTIAAIPAATPPVDLQSISDAITAIKAVAASKVAPAG